MKRSLILLLFMLLCTGTLMFLTYVSEEKHEKIQNDLNLENKGIKDLYGIFNNKEMNESGNWKKVEAFRDMNLHTLKNPAEIFMDIDSILSDLEIEYENTKMPDADPQILGDYKYYEYKLALECTFEDFTQFIINLEKSDKIFIIYELIFDNDNFSSKQQEINKSFEITLWAISFNKTKKKTKKKKA